MAGGADVDWFTYLARTQPGAGRCDCVVERRRARLHRCVLQQRSDRVQVLQIGEKTTVAGVDGCCARGGKVELEHECTLLGLADDADV